MSQLPEGFVLDAPSQSGPSGLPEGFVLDTGVSVQPSGRTRITVTPDGGPQARPVPTPKVGMAEDVGKSTLSGLVNGVIGLAGMPGDFAEYGARGIDLASRYVGDKLGVNVAQRQDRAPTYGSEDVRSYVESVTGPLYKPQTTAGKYAHTAGEFASGAIGGGGGVVARAARVLVPAVASEGAGQLTEGTAAEPFARVGGAIVGGVTAGLASRPGTAARAIREQLPEGVTPQMMDDAAALMERAAQQGITLTWPEALSQTAGRPVLTNVQRHLEAAPQTEARMAEFFGQRPQQIDTAGRNAIDGIAPVNNVPSSIGPAVGQAAEGVVNDVRNVINVASEPLYRTASTVRLSGPEMARIRAHPGWPEARDAIRNDPQLNRYVAGLPEDSVGFLNEVKKYLDTAAENAAGPVNAQRNMQRSAGYGLDATAVRDAARRASPEYGQALDFQAHARERYLQPLLDGPLGKIASRDTATRDAINALFPVNPLPNSADEITRAVSQLARRNPNAASDLVRAHVESVFNESTRALQSGANQAGGAKFVVKLIGNPQQRENLEAAVRALPNGADRLEGLNRFMEAAQATGTRQNIGSRTAYNAELLKNEAASGIAGDTAKAVANPLRGAQFLADRYERWRLGQNLNELADILTDPAALNRLRAIARMNPNSSQASQTAARLAIQFAASRNDTSRGSAPTNR